MGGGNLNGARVALLAAVVLGLGTGCARPPPFHRSDALARSRALLDRVSALEADLHSQSTEIGLFSELNERRQEATQVTCNVTQSHIKEIQRLAELQQQKRRARQARRVALLGSSSPRRESPWR